MTRDELVFSITVIDAFCWMVCFWWMHRISTKQNNVLAQIQEQSKRIEKLSKAEHDLIKEVHPQVGDIKASVDEVKAVVKPDGRNRT